MQIVRISRNDWKVKITEDDKDKIRFIARELKDVIDENDGLKPFGYWKSMKSEEIWQHIIIQFCVMRGTNAWDKLKEKKVEYREFLEKMKLENLVNKENRIGFLRETFRKYKPTILVKKPEKETSPHPDIPDRIEQFLNNKNAVKEGKLILFDGLDSLTNENEIRDILLRRCGSSFKMKSISDFMISIGAAKNFIALDTRIIGLFKKYFHLNGDVNLTSIQSNKSLYKAIEKELMEICANIGINLSTLDRILFRSSEISAIDYLMEKISIN